MDNYNANQEIWKDVKGYEGLYAVSNFGRVSKISKSGHKLMKLIETGHGYKQLGLTKNGKRKFFLVHRIVASAFIPRPLDLDFINHIDRDPTNNCAKNLEWCTIAQNNSKRRGISIVQKKLDGTVIETFDSFSDANKKHPEFKIRGIGHCVQGHSKTYKGYIWERI